MILIFILIVLLNSYESSINLFRVFPYSDLASVGGIGSVSLIDRKTGFYSPSFLSNLNGSSFSGSFWKDYLSKGYFSFFSFSYDIDEKSGANFTYYGYNSGSEEIYKMDGSFESVVFEKNYILSTSYGFYINEKLLLGIKAKYISSTLLEKYNSSTYTFDGEFFLNLHPYGIKFNIDNLNGKIRYIDQVEKLPLFVGIEFSRFFIFNDFFLSSGFGLKKSQDYSIYSIANEVFVKKFPFKINFAYQKDDLSRFFIGLGLFFENIYISSSISFPKMFQSNDLRFSLTYFFNSQNFSYFKDGKQKVIKKPSSLLQKPKKEEEKEKKKELNVIVF